MTSDWTPDIDAKIIEARASGRSFRSLGAELGIDRQRLARRSLEIGAIYKEPEPAEEAPSSNRHPLPAGHPISWGAINAGTCNEGADYPVRVFL